ncbi:MAG: response regulator [Verrucomicrobiae bacterium]|nr:response regulator [Verrucomicrobiae bacterium]
MNTEQKNVISLEGKQVLVVDDDPIQLLSIRHMINDTGCRIIESDDPRRVLDIIKRQQIDLIILDVMMPSMSGWEVFQKIRETSRYRETPVIFLTALVRKEEEEQFNQQRDFYRVLAKPVEMDCLLPAIEELLS